MRLELNIMPGVVTELWVAIKEITVKGIVYKVRGLYEVSSWGNIRYNNVPITMYGDKGGYRSVNIRIHRDVGKKTKKALVHRLVASAFLANIDNLPCVNHKKGNKTDNRYWMLEWCTAEYNMIHSFGIGLHGIGEDHHSTSLTNEQVHDICRMLADGLANKEIRNRIPEITNSNKYILTKLRNARAWRHITEKYDIKTNPYCLTTEDIISICHHINDGINYATIVDLVPHLKLYKTPTHMVSKIKRGRKFSTISKHHLIS